jgi:hypothetical protein
MLESYNDAARICGRFHAACAVEIGADETWGLLIGSGGAMPLQMY